MLTAWLGCRQTLRAPVLNPPPTSPRRSRAGDPLNATRARMNRYARPILFEWVDSVRQLHVNVAAEVNLSAPSARGIVGGHDGARGYPNVPVEVHLVAVLNDRLSQPV